MRFWVENEVVEKRSEKQEEVEWLHVEVKAIMWVSYKEGI